MVLAQMSGRIFALKTYYLQSWRPDEHHPFNLSYCILLIEIILLNLMPVCITFDYLCMSDLGLDITWNVVLGVDLWNGTCIITVRCLQKPIRLFKIQYWILWAFVDVLRTVLFWCNCGWGRLSWFDMGLTCLAVRGPKNQFLGKTCMNALV
jgi:hypothetical protein